MMHHPTWNSPIFCFYIIFLFLFIPSCTSLEVINDTKKFEACKHRLKCGLQQEFTYPFWGSKRSRDCGHPGFRVDCLDNTPFISINSWNYSILSVAEERQELTVVRRDMMDDGCPEHLVPITLDTNLFNFPSNYRNMTFIYSCSSDILVNDSITCPPKGASVGGVYRNLSLTEYYVWTCGFTLDFPVSGNLPQNLLEGGASPKEIVKRGFNLEFNADRKNCMSCLSAGGQCGHDWSADKFVCYLSGQAIGTSKRSIKIVAVATPAAGICVLAILAFYCRNQLSSGVLFFWMKKTEDDQKIEAFLKDNGPLALRRYSFTEVKKITNSFTEKLGQGGYGSVYKGKLPDGSDVAVKVLTGSKGNGEEFINEVASISKTSHVNIVTLSGFCFQGRKRALIYEFMPNGSLEKYIHNEDPLNPDRKLGWNTLYSIAVGIARGLEYLHRGCNAKILHFDIKPHNVLLDENFGPKISDFGLAKICPRIESIVSMQGARGTAGYIAPEVADRSYGPVSHKSDVYSYGVLVQEMVGGRKSLYGEVDRSSEVYFPNWVYKQLEPGKELRLHGTKNDDDERKSRQLILVSLWCMQTDPAKRPSMCKVIEMLQGTVESLSVPSTPYLCSPARSPARSVSSSSTTPILAE